MAEQSQYTAANITVLEGLDPVRKRPGMYIGGTGIEGLHHLVWEILDNSIDEAMGGHANEITVTLHKNNRVSVLDNGRGIPVDKIGSTGKSALETVLTVLHAGGKFGGGGYKVSGGLHGVGVSVVNALSSYVRAEVYRGGKVYAQEYDTGKPRKDVTTIGKTPEGLHGTYVVFDADPTIFPEIKYNTKTIIDRIRQKAYLTKGITITFIDATETEEETDVMGKGYEWPQGKSYTFYFEGGIASYVRHLNKGKTAYNEPPFYMEKVNEDTVVEVAIQYADDFNEHVYTFANTEYTVEGGTHLTGFRTALTRVINDYAKKNNLVKDADSGLTGDDVREGLTAVISVKLAEPQFEGQTKGKLGNPEMRTIVDAAVTEKLTMYFEEHPAEARKIIEKSLLSLRARLAAKAARETVIRKGALEGMTLPGKLADCSERDPKKSELYIVEGDSAGGCFAGDTLVALTDGRNIPFTQLVEEHAAGKQNYCYTIKADGSVGIAPILHPRITKYNAATVKVTLDNNEEIICTPDHKFMLRDGSYKQAKDLSRNDSLMPLYRRYSKINKRITIEGYEMVYDQQKRWVFTHMLADQVNRVHQYFIEHPEKIDALSKQAQDQWNSPELRAWRADVTKKQWTPDFRAKRKQSYNETYRSKALATLSSIYATDGVIDKDKYQAIRRTSNDKTLLKYETVLNRYFDGNEAELQESVAQYNHKVRSVVELTERADVYDIEVPETHNFALASGVFVHNSAKQGRDRRFQAILPLRGKVLNVERARLDRMLSSEAIKHLIIAIGVGVGEQKTMDKLRYNRIILMTDADVDGAHIRTLLLTLIYRHFPELIREGHIYIAQPPLYAISKGKEKHFAYTDDQRDEILKMIRDKAATTKAAKGKAKAEAVAEEIAIDDVDGAEVELTETAGDAGSDVVSVGGISIQRYKGLGEMNAEQLWDTTMNPENRVLLQVNEDDAAKADEVFSMLMGDEVAPRKRFIQTHAKYVKNLDV